MASQDGPGGSRVEPRFESLDDADGGFRPAAHEPESNLRGKLLGALVAVAAVAGFGGIAWYATTQGQKDSAMVVPLIRADNSPVKVLPAKPGGMEVPNQDKLIFMRINPGQKKAKVERLLPPPEKPMATLAPIEAPIEKPMERPAKTPPLGPLVAKPGILASGTEPSPPAPKAARPAPAPKPAQAAAKAAAKIPPAKPKPVTPKNKPVEAIAPVKPKAKVMKAAKAAPASKAPAAAAQGAFRVQLGAVKSKTGAQKEIRRLTRRYQSLLAGLTVKAVRTDLGRRGIFYRLRAGPLAGRTAAAALCAKFKARKQGCMVIRP